MDISQVFYLWQNWLYNALVGEDLLELAHEDDGRADQAKITHVPWWRFVDYKGEVPFSADIVICDAAIAEMSKHARHFVIQSVKKMFRPDGPKIFLVPNPGGTWKYSKQDIVNDFSHFGFDLINVFGFHAYACGNPKLSKYAVKNHDQIYSNRIDRRMSRWISRNLFNDPGGKFYREICDDPHQLFFEPLGNGKTVSATDIIKPDWREAPLDYEFYDYIGRRIPPVGGRPATD